LNNEVCPSGLSKQPVFAKEKSENIGRFAFQALDINLGCGKICFSIHPGL